MPDGHATSRGLIQRPPADYVEGRWRPLPEGDGIVSRNPARPSELLWSAESVDGHVAEAVAAAGRAFGAWRALDHEVRVEAMGRWKQAASERAGDLAVLIGLETGKIASEATAEAGLLATKVDITLGPHSSGRVAGYDVAAGETRIGRCTFRPHGVMAVLGPYNFPAHLPNGHIVPALLAGNTIVFKPSDKTPAVGQLLAEIAEAAELPRGVFNLVQGGAAPAASLVAHEGVDGILFTGSWPIPSS